jgi:hypothetical protein
MKNENNDNAEILCVGCNYRLPLGNADLCRKCIAEDVVVIYPIIYQNNDRPLVHFAEILKGSN